MSLTDRKSYFYNLPSDLIAQYPLKNRTESRLLVLDKNNGSISHHKFHNILNLLNEDDVLVINTSKVFPARLKGEKKTGAKIEILMLEEKENHIWKCLVKPGSRCNLGTEIKISEELTSKVVDIDEKGHRILEFYCEQDFWELIYKYGSTPLPPYIKREADKIDSECYQTVYANQNGSCAAPTAGLHFDKALLEKIQKKKIEILTVLLHVGVGTFQPVKADSITEHKMHSEICEISKDTADKINNYKSRGRRIISVGTTTTRTLESFFNNGFVQHGRKSTDIFIYPGKKINVIDGLITNFHLPESTLIMLVCAFAGYDNTMKAYKEAVTKKYRFFSYGDAMFIV